jgi:hypothetical protein
LDHTRDTTRDQKHYSYQAHGYTSLLVEVERKEWKTNRKAGSIEELAYGHHPYPTVKPLEVVGVFNHAPCKLANGNYYTPYLAYEVAMPPLVPCHDEKGVLSDIRCPRNPE